MTKTGTQHSVGNKHLNPIIRQTPGRKVDAKWTQTDTQKGREVVTNNNSNNVNNENKKNKTLCYELFSPFQLPINQYPKKTSFPVIAFVSPIEKPDKPSTTITAKQ